MKPVPRRRVADYVSPALSEARIARMWSAVAETERARRREPEGPASAGRRVTRSWAIPILAAVAAVVALVVGLRLRSPQSPVMAGLVIDTGSAQQEVALPDGSTLSLGPATRLRVVGASAGEIRLHLERGNVACEVVHREERRFVIAAGTVEVEDRGTRFEVEVRPGSGQDVVAVRVDRGAVEAFDAVIERASEPFLEDAEAGRVEALADLGDHEACARARDAFRARHPRSPQEKRVARLCGGP